MLSLLVVVARQMILFRLTEMPTTAHHLISRAPATEDFSFMYHERQRGEVSYGSWGGWFWNWIEPEASGFRTLALPGDTIIQRVLWFSQISLYLFVGHFVELDVQNLNEVDKSRLWVHAVQLLPQNSFRENETIETVSLEPSASSTTVIPVTVSIYWREERREGERGKGEGGEGQSSA